MDMIKYELQESNVCLDHLEHSRTDSISVPRNCSSYCTNRIELGTACDACSGKGHIVFEPALRPCDFCLEKKFSALKQQLSASLRIQNEEMSGHTKGL